MVMRQTIIAGWDGLPAPSIILADETNVWRLKNREKKHERNKA